MHFGIGHPTVGGGPVDPTKQAFLAAVVDACEAQHLAFDVSG